MILEQNTNKINGLSPVKKTTIRISKTTSSILGLLFLGNLFYLIYYYPNIPQWSEDTILRINGFTVLIWTAVTFFGAIVSRYATKYLDGFRYQNRFSLLCLGFTFSIMLLLAANHLFLFLVSWLLMGVFMSRLIGVDKNWGEAQEASKFTQRYFLGSTIFLGIGLVTPALYADVFSLTGLVHTWETLPSYIVLVSAMSIILAALMQSAIYPFHRWLLSAMTAPTPASALMHAGFVNGSGILLALFASIFFISNTLEILLIIGGLTAIIAQFSKLLQVNVKQKLACSTIAQMGFMIMQCGLGFFNAAIVHLILHGFYKAYLFLASGEEVEQLKVQKTPEIKITAAQSVIVLIFGLMGAFLFMILTGKGTTLDSSIFLTLIVAITVGQATYNIVKQQNLTLIQKAVWPPVLFLSGIGIYALLFNGVTTLMSGMPMIAQAVPLSVIQVVFGLVFLIGFFIMKLGVYQKVPWLYVKLMNLSQPYKKSILMYKSKY